MEDLNIMENTLYNFLKNKNIQVNEYYENMYSFVMWIECKRFLKEQTILDFCKCNDIDRLWLIGIGSSAGMSRGSEALLERMDESKYKNLDSNEVINQLKSNTFNILEYLIDNKKHNHFIEDYYEYALSGILDYKTN